MRSMTAFVLSAALLCSTSAYALEITSHNDLKNVNAGLEQRLESTKAALLAAFNSLKDTIDDLLARVGALETDMVAVKAKNVEQDNRLNAIDTTNSSQDAQIYGMRTTQPANWNTALEARLKALEEQGSGGVPVPDLTKCSNIATSANKGQMIMCPAGRLLVGLANNGLSTSAKNVYVSGHCCELKMQ